MNESDIVFTFGTPGPVRAVSYIGDEDGRPPSYLVVWNDAPLPIDAPGAEMPDMWHTGCFLSRYPELAEAFALAREAEEAWATPEGWRAVDDLSDAELDELAGVTA